MNKTLKRCLAVLTCLTVGVVPLLSGCNKNNRSVNELEIRFYNGGFGTQWIEYAKTEFEKANEGVSVTLIPDSELSSSIGTYLESGKRLSDLYFSQSLDWQYYVNRGLVEPLDEVYATEVEKLDGTKIKIEDYIRDDRVEVGKMSESFGEAAHYWTMPWSTLNCGMLWGAVSTL